jgi:hypothetical protein
MSKVMKDNDTSQIKIHPPGSAKIGRLGYAIQHNVSKSGYLFKC